MNRRRVSSRGRGPPTRRRRPPKMRITRAASKTQRHIRFQDRSRLFATWPTPAGRRTPKRRPRRPKGQGLFAGWVRGWGLGGTPSGVGCPTPSAASGSGPIKLFFGGAVLAVAPLAGSAPIPSGQRQSDLPPVGKLQITQTDMETAIAAARPFHHVPCADRKPFRKLTCEPIHNELLQIPCGTKR